MIRVQREDFDFGREVAALSDGNHGVGGVCAFAGLVRDRIGVGNEELAPPDGVDTVEALIDWLKGRSEGHGKAFEDLSVIRVAVNQEHVQLDHAVAAGDEIAFFPPVTGG